MAAPNQDRVALVIKNKKDGAPPIQTINMIP